MKIYNYLPTGYYRGSRMTVHKAFSHNPRIRFFVTKGFLCSHHLWIFLLTIKQTLLYKSQIRKLLLRNFIIKRAKWGFHFVITVVKPHHASYNHGNLFLLFTFWANFIEWLAWVIRWIFFIYIYIYLLKLYKSKLYVLNLYALQSRKV